MNVSSPNNIFKQYALNLNLSFRLATEDDLPKLEWMGEYLHFRRVFQYTFREQQNGRRAMLLAIFNNFPIGQAFILFKEDRTFLGHAPRRGYLYSVRVMLPFQGLGIGTKLILQAESLMVQRKIGQSTIAVSKENLDAKRLYERLGYQIYTEDDGQWSYTNHEGNVVEVDEPCWMLYKNL